MFENTMLSLNDLIDKKDQDDKKMKTLKTLPSLIYDGYDIILKSTTLISEENDAIKKSVSTTEK